MKNRLPIKMMLLGVIMILSSVMLINQTHDSNVYAENIDKQKQQEYIFLNTDMDKPVIYLINEDDKLIVKTIKELWIGGKPLHNYNA